MQTLLFHASIHARSENVKPSGEPLGSATDIEKLSVSPEDLQKTFPVSFEDAEAALANIARMFVEPDGSFVWRSEESNGLQLDGGLYDNGEYLTFVELAGKCTEPMLDSVLSAFGWPKAQLMFQLRDSAVFLSDECFRRWAKGQAEEVG